MNEDIKKSATSLASVQSSPATVSGIGQAGMDPVLDSANNPQTSNNKIDVSHPNAHHQQSSVDSNVESENVTGEPREVQVDVHAGNVGTTSVAEEADSSPAESSPSGEEPEKDAGIQDSCAGDTSLVPGDIDPGQYVEKADVALKTSRDGLEDPSYQTDTVEKQSRQLGSAQPVEKPVIAETNAVTPNDTDATGGDHFKRQREQSNNNIAGTQSVIHDEQQDKAPTRNSKDTPNTQGPTPRVSPSFLRSHGPCPVVGEADNSPETIPLENISKNINDGTEIDDTTCPLELVTKLERELFTDEERALLAQCQKNVGDSDALEKIMTGEFDRELKASLNA